MTRIEYMETRMQLTEKLLAAIINLLSVENNNVRNKRIKNVMLFHKHDLNNLKQQAINEGIIAHE